MTTPENSDIIGWMCCTCSTQFSRFLWRILSNNNVKSPNLRLKRQRDHTTVNSIYLDMDVVHAFLQPQADSRPSPFTNTHLRECTNSNISLQTLAWFQFSGKETASIIGYTRFFFFEFSKPDINQTSVKTMSRQDPLVPWALRWHQCKAINWKGKTKFNGKWQE